MAGDRLNCCSSGTSPMYSRNMSILYADSGKFLAQGSSTIVSRNSANSSAESGHAQPKVAFNQPATFCHVFTCFLNIFSFRPLATRIMRASSPDRIATGKRAALTRSLISFTQRLYSSRSTSSLRKKSSAARCNFCPRRVDQVHLYSHLNIHVLLIIPPSNFSLINHLCIQQDLRTFLGIDHIDHRCPHRKATHQVLHARYDFF